VERGECRKGGKGSEIRGKGAIFFEVTKKSLSEKGRSNPGEEIRKVFSKAEIGAGNNHDHLKPFKVEGRKKREGSTPP